MFIIEFKGRNGVISSCKSQEVDVYKDVGRFMYTKNLIIDHVSQMRFKVYYQNYENRYYYIDYKKAE